MISSVTPNNIRKIFGKSGKMNTFKMFWDSVMDVYNPPDITDEYNWEKQYCEVALCPNPYTTITHLFDNSLAIGFPEIRFEICSENYIDYIYEDLLNFHFIKYATFASSHNPKAKYYILIITIQCLDEDSHRITGLISDNDKTISIFEPNTSIHCDNSYVCTDNMFVKLINLYDKLNNAVVRLHDGTKYTVLCPCYKAPSKGLSGIQDLLSYKNRCGSCAIISLLIVHVAIYTKNTSIELLKNIYNHLIIQTSKDRVRFADAYLQFISKGIHISKSKLDTEISMIFDDMTLSRGLLEHLKYTNEIDKRIIDDFFTKFFKPQDLTNLITERVFSHRVKRTIVSHHKLSSNNSNILNALNKIPDTNITSSDIIYKYLVGELYGSLSVSHNDQTHYFRIFTDNKKGFIWIHEVDNKVKLQFLSPTHVFIDTYYTNDKSGPNLDVLRKMLINFPNVQITDETKIRMDDYQDIPYGLWPFVKYNKSQFYMDDPEKNATSIQKLLCKTENRLDKFSSINIKDFWYKFNNNNAYLDEGFKFVPEFENKIKLANKYKYDNKKSPISVLVYDNTKFGAYFSLYKFISTLYKYLELSDIEAEEMLIK